MPGARQIIGDLAVVWLLSPRRNFRPPPVRPLAKALAAIPAHCLQVRPRPAERRGARARLPPCTKRAQRSFFRYLVHCVHVLW